MQHFHTRLAPGGKAPYDRWTFVVLPKKVVAALGRPPFALRGTLAGVAFRGSASTGEGVVRMSVPRDLRAAAGVECGDRVEVTLELDPEPRPVEIPPELAALFRADPDLAERFDRLPPAHRRAWAQHVAEAKRPDTRERRAQKAIDGIRGKLFPGQ